MRKYSGITTQELKSGEPIDVSGGLLTVDGPKAGWAIELLFGAVY